MKSSLGSTRRRPAHNSSRKGTNRLGAYLAAGLGATTGITATSDAAIVMIDLTNVNGQNITAANGGVSSGSSRSISNWLGAGTGTLELYNENPANPDTYIGLDGDASGGIDLLFAAGSTFASPINFSSGTTINSSSTFTGSASRTVFLYRRALPNGSIYESANFGAGSFMGFRFGSGSSWNYGYLEVTWNSSTDTFQILSGAYESTVNTGILAGATPSAVPGAGLSAMALMALGGGAFRRRSRDRVA